jgi:hypothetical protein
MKRQHPTDPNLFWCTKCQTWRKKNTEMNAKSSWCKKCRNQSQKDRYLKNPQKYRDISKIRRELGLQKRGKVKTVCVQCKKEYFGRKDGSLKFCSKKCAGEWHKKRITFQCPSCGLGFELPLCRMSDGHMHFCSKKCRNHYNSLISKKYGAIYGFKKGHESPRKGTIIVPMDVQKEKRRTNYNKRRDNLLGSYLAQIIRANKQEATPTTIELTRQRIIMKRTLKEFKQWRKEQENESDDTDVHGKQREDEENYEGRV